MNNEEASQVLSVIKLITDPEYKHLKENEIARQAFEKGHLPHVIKAAFKTLNYIVTTDLGILIFISSPAKRFKMPLVAYLH